MLTPPAQARLIAQADPRRAPRGVPRRRAHADARTHRRARPADRRLRARGRRGAAQRCRRRRALTRGARRVAIPIAGVRVGHWTGAGTGVTVVLAPEGTVGAGEVRGGAPATRELALLEPGRTVDARRRGRARRRLGVRARGGRRRDALPRRARAGLPDRGRAGADRARRVRVRSRRARASARPGADEGYAAAVAAAAATRLRPGRVGAGRGATVGKWRGREHAVPAASASRPRACDDAHVVAFAVVNAVGDVIGADGARRRGLDRAAGRARRSRSTRRSRRSRARQHDARGRRRPTRCCDKLGCHLVAQSAHDGLARALRPGAHPLRRRPRDRARDRRGRGAPRPAARRGRRRRGRGDSHRAPVASAPSGHAARTGLGRGVPCHSTRSSHPRIPRTPRATTLAEVAAVAVGLRRCASSRRAARRWCSASGAPTPICCSSARARASRKTCKGEPFVGRAGQLLTQLIEGIGLTRADVYIANVVKCRPPGNRDPQPDEIEACAPWLDRQLALIRAARDRDARQLRDEAAARHQGGHHEAARAGVRVRARRRRRRAAPDAAPVGGAAVGRQGARRVRAPTSCA